MPQIKHPYPGIFIAAEGADGTGKSWAVQQLEQIITGIDGRAPVMVREPGGTTFGEMIRDTLAEFRQEISPEAQALAFNASRRELADQIIRPALQQGRTVVTDRWTPSTRVYQRECPEDMLNAVIIAAAAELVHADLTLLFTRNPEDAVMAKIDEYGADNREQEITYLHKIQNLYLEEMARADPDRWVHCPFTNMDDARANLRRTYRNAKQRLRPT